MATMLDLEPSKYQGEKFVWNSIKNNLDDKSSGLSEKIETVSKDVQNVTDEIIDRFGQMPYEVENLLDVARIKILAREKYILKIAQRKENLIFYFDSSKFNFEIVDKLMKTFRNRIKFSPSKDPYITFKILDMKKILEECIDFLKKL